MDKSEHIGSMCIPMSVYAPVDNNLYLCFYIPYIHFFVFSSYSVFSHSVRVQFSYSVQYFLIQFSISYSVEVFKC